MMKIKRNQFTKLISFLGILLIVCGCYPNEANFNESTAATGSIVTLADLPTKTPKQVKSETPTPEPRPTLTMPPTPGVEERIPSLTILKDLECPLPCHLGITPGVTTAQEACEILLLLRPWLQQTLDDSCLIDRGLSFGESDNSKEGNYFYWISITTQNDIVQSLRLMIDVHSETVIDGYFSQLLLDGIFESMGMPDEIVVDPHDYVNFVAFHFLLTYYDENVIYEFGGGNHSKESICIHPTNFQQEPAGILVHAGISFLGQAMVEPIYQTEPSSSYYTIEEVFGITEEEFYKQVLVNPDACFDIMLD